MCFILVYLLPGHGFTLIETVKMPKAVSTVLFRPLILLYILIFVLFYYFTSQQWSHHEQLDLRVSIRYESTFNTQNHLLAFLHIQKTGGSDFDRAIIHHLQVLNRQKGQWSRGCSESSVVESYDKFKGRRVKFKKYQCRREACSDKSMINWYFSRQTFGWACGLHPNLDQLKACITTLFPHIDPGDVYYFTILREPVRRYISEYLHVRRGATWIRREHTQDQRCVNQLYQKCFSNRQKWINVTLDEFLNCEYNLANNRETRMLLTFPNVSSSSSPCRYLQYDQDPVKMLEIAKQNLAKMSFFAINEFQNLSQYLFDQTFKGALRLNFNFSQSNQSLAESYLKQLSPEVVQRIRQRNSVDIELYEYALKLFSERIKNNNKN